VTVRDRGRIFGDGEKGKDKGLREEGGRRKEEGGKEMGKAEAR
jgi:hypothetical protein